MAKMPQLILNVTIGVILGALISQLYSYKSTSSTSLINLRTNVTENIESNETAFSWNSITPTENLSFTSCFGDFECARLKLPLDWNDTSIAEPDEFVALAVLKLPALVPVTDPRYGGPLILGPGGPGGSGVGMLYKFAKDLRTVVDSPVPPFPTNRNDTNEAPESQEALHTEVRRSYDSTNAKYFDLISFDPRGINSSTPFLTCFHNATLRRQWDALTNSFIPGEGGEVSTSYLWARQVALSQSCVHHPVHNPNGSKIATRMSTVSSARDVIELTEKYGLWREMEAQRLLGQSTTVPERLRYTPGEEPIQYWGISYGTTLGSTIASIQPHRIKRMILDAVMDQKDLFHGEFVTSVTDADALMGKFFEYCHLAGPSGCALAKHSTSVSEMKKKWTAMQHRFETHGPIVVPAHTYQPPNADESSAAAYLANPTIISLSDIRTLVWKSSYNPVKHWPTLATTIAPLLSDTPDGTALAQHKFEQAANASHAADHFDAIDPYNPEHALQDYNWLDALAAVHCGEMPAKHGMNQTIESFLEYQKELTSVSHFLGPGWSTLRWRCAGWPARARWIHDPSDGSAVTANPILFIGNRRDPVTPLQSAKRMSKLFKGSQVLEVDGEGHATTSVASVCAYKHVRAYLQRGELPEDGIEACKPQNRALLGDKGPDVEGDPDYGDIELRDAALGLQMGAG